MNPDEYDGKENVNRTINCRKMDCIIFPLDFSDIILEEFLFFVRIIICP